MSKYQERGAYHYAHYRQINDPYRLHTDDVIAWVKKLVEPGKTLVDLGCGEGLLVSKLRDAGYDSSFGVEDDPVAVAWALKLGNPVIRGDITKFSLVGIHAVLALDVLEHVSKWKDVIDKMDGVDVLFIALPDRDDPYAVNKNLSFYREVRSYVGSHDFEVIHSERRHARYFTIYKRCRQR